MINKSSLEECARKLGQPGLYATFRTYYEDDEEEHVDKGYWGQVAHVEEVFEDEPEEGWEEDNDGEFWRMVMIYVKLIKV